MILKGLTLEIKANESVSIIGTSGCGKSTILGLIVRFYDPTSGNIEIDGVDIKHYDIKYLR